MFQLYCFSVLMCFVFLQICSSAMAHLACCGSAVFISGQFSLFARTFTLLALIARWGFLCVQAAT